MFSQVDGDTVLNEPQSYPRLHARLKTVLSAQSPEGPAEKLEVKAPCKVHFGWGKQEVEG